MILILPIDEICSIFCKTCLDTFEDYAVHCKELSNFKYRYEVVINVLFNVYHRVDIFVKKEAVLNFLTDLLDERSTFR